VGNETEPRRRLIVAVTGASGAIYAVRLLKACVESGLHIDLVVSDYGRRLLIEECDLNLKAENVAAWLDRSYGAQERPGGVELQPHGDLGAPIASGSRQWAGMVVVPCSMKTLSGIAYGASTNLIERAADVTLKERRPLILVPRETPMNLIHLDNLSLAARAGATIVPAMPAFYFKPQSFEDLADFVAGRILSLLEIPHSLFQAWKA